jgi:hypothetical protein
VAELQVFFEIKLSHLFLEPLWDVVFSAKWGAGATLPRVARGYLY